MNKRIKSLLSIVLCITLVLSNIAFADATSAQPANYADVAGNMYEVQIREWIANGFIKGYPDGNFKPENQITRSEFMALVNRAYGFADTMDIKYSDITKTEWYYNDAAIATKAGFIQGANGKLMPLDNISRQEMAVILSRLTKNEKAAADDAVINIITDKNEIPAWSKAAISVSMKNKFFDGFVDMAFKPTEKITRLEAVVALDRAFKSMYKAAYTVKGAYGPETGMETFDGDVVVIAPDVTLKNITINGNLILRETIGEGNVYLDNVVVKGETIVKGGGANSIVIKNSTLGRIIIIKEGNTVRIVATGSTTIGTVDIGANAKLEEFELTGTGFNDIIVLDDIPAGTNVVFEGNFGDVEIDSPNINVTLQSGTIGSLNLTETAVDTNINLGQQTTVTTMTLNVATNVTGTGTIGTANINVTGTIIEQQPTTVVTAPNVIAQVAGKPVNEPTTPVPSLGGGGGGGGSTLQDIEMDFNNSLVVVGYSEHNPDIKTLNPVDATLTYVSSDSTIVAINEITGKMTGVKAGETTITVTARKSGYRTTTTTFRVTVVAEANKLELKALINEASNLNEADYTTESWGPFEIALEAAKDVDENIFASEEQVSAAKTALTSAKVALTLKTAPIVKYTLTLTGDGLTSQPAAGEIVKNASVVVTIAVPEGKRIAAFTVGGLDKKASIVDNKYTFNITANTAVVVTYEDIPVAEVEDLNQLKAALANREIEIINITADFPTSEKIVVSRPVTINGGTHMVSFTGDVTEWQGNYVMQVYNTTGVTINNLKLTGGDAGLLINGSTVTLTGTIDVTENEFGGIEVSKGTASGLLNSQLTVSGILVNFTEEYARPTLWLVNGQGTVIGGPVTTNTTIKADQKQYYLDAENAVKEYIIASASAINATTVSVTSATTELTKDNFVFEPSVTISNVQYSNGIYTLTLADPGLTVNTVYELIVSKEKHYSYIIENLGYSDIDLAAENFNTNKAADYIGINVGWDIADTNMDYVVSMKVELYSGETLLATNTGEMDMLEGVTGGKFSTPFIMAEGTYKADEDDYWSFGSWTPAELTVPTKAVITITDIFGREYVDTNESLAAEAGKTWADLFETPELVTLLKADFGTRSDVYMTGINVGWLLGNTDLELITSMKVELYAGAELLATNTATAEKAKQMAKDYPSANGSFSTPFVVKEGLYKISEDLYWTFGDLIANKDKIPTNAIITVTDIYGREYEVNNDILATYGGEWESLFTTPTLVTLAAENFNTNKAADYVGINVGWDIADTNMDYVVSMKVELLDVNDVVIATNTGEMDMLESVINGKFSTPFFIAEGTYKADEDDYWSFGSWTPAETTIPTKAVITITDIFGREYVATNESLAAEAGKAWTDLFTTPTLVNLAAENLNTNKAADYVGVNVGWDLGDTSMDHVVSMKVELYSGETLLATNTGEMDMLEGVTGGKFSTPFIIAEGTYKADKDNYWSFGAWTAAEDVVPTKAVITITDIYGREYIATNESLATEADKDWTDLFPKTYINEEAAAYVVAENFNTHSGADYKGINVGFELVSLNTDELISIEVSLFKEGEEPLVTNSADMDMINGDRPAKGHSTPFIITKGSYVEEYWKLGDYDWTTDDKPTKAVIRIVDQYNNMYIVENNSLSEATAEFESLITVPDTTEPVISNGRVYFDGVNRINVEFEVDEDIDLRKDGLGNIVIRYGTIVNDEFEDLLRADNTAIIKNKNWSGYLNGPSSEKYGQGYFEDMAYLPVVPADTLMQTTVDSRYETMNYADQTWNDLLSQGDIVVQVEVTDNAGNSAILEINSEN